jgi:hypothetical protein
MQGAADVVLTSRAWRLLVGTLAIGLGSLGLASCVADPAPVIGAVAAGDGRVLLSWDPPAVEPAPITGYVVTPWAGTTALAPVVFSSTATTQIVGGLRNGVAHTFTVAAVNALGNESASSGHSSSVVPGPPLAATYDRTCALVEGGAAKCWGASSLNPQAVPGLTGATALTASDRHTCALVAAGEVQCWGANFSGQLGNGTTAASSAPVTVSGVTDAVAVEARDTGYTCALLAGGTVWCWGEGALTPVAVAGLTDATAIGAGTSHHCAVVTGGIVRCWGRNTYGQLGNGTTSDLVTTTPVQVAGITGATAVTGGVDYTCVRLPGGAMKCWGGNTTGALGDGTGSGSLAPVSVVGMSGARVVAGGWFHLCAITDGGTAKCWGDNGWGQLGDATNNQRNAPVAVTGLAGAIALESGGYHTCAVLPDAVTCWGNNESGQLGLGSAGGASWTPVTVIGL